MIICELQNIVYVDIYIHIRKHVHIHVHACMYTSTNTSLRAKGHRNINDKANEARS